MEIICRINNEYAPVLSGENLDIKIDCFELVCGKEDICADLVFDGEGNLQQCSKENHNNLLKIFIMLLTYVLRLGPIKIKTI